MRILIVGASGRVGSAAVAKLRSKHDVVGVSRSTSPAIDLHDQQSIVDAFVELGTFDAVISAYGTVPFKSAVELTASDLVEAFRGKVLSQLQFLEVALRHVHDGGSVTLTSGIMAREAIRHGSAAAMANAAIEAFVMAASGEMPRGIRLNVVSPSVLQSAPEFHEAFAGFQPVTDEQVGMAFLRSLEGLDTGRTFTVE